MRRIILALASLCLLSATPSWARSAGLFRTAEHLIVSRGLLTPAELACSYFTFGPQAIQEASQIVVLEKHGGPCPGDPRTPPRVRFSLFVDPMSGAVQWNYPDPTILEDLPLPGQPPTVPSVLTSCGVCAQP